MLKKLKTKKGLLLILIILVIILGVAIFLLNKFLFTQEVDLKQEDKSGNINILLLGRAGNISQPESPDLTDTIMVASINQEKNAVSLISIPRDIWIDEIDSKINASYLIGKKKGDNDKILLKSIIKKVTGKQIDYVVVIDFSGFVTLIDHLGGIDIEVRNTLTDYRYPVMGAEDDLCEHEEENLIDLVEQIATGSAREEEVFPCRYKQVHFEKGLHVMTGEDALIFVRSRHGLNGEGTDFARSQRQQDVIAAVRNKVLSLGIILNPIKVVGIFNILKDNIDTNIQVNEFDDFINLANKIQNAKVTSIVLDMGDEDRGRYGLLYNPSISEAHRYQWVLAPRIGSDDFSEIKEFIQCVEEGFICEIEEDGILRVGFREALDN